MTVSHKYRIAKLQKMDCCRITTDGCFRSFMQSSACKASVFSESSLVPPFFSLEALPIEGFPTVKVRKKNHQSDFGLHRFFF